MMRNIAYALSLAVILLGCAGSKTTTTTSKTATPQGGGGYSEDLAIYRPKPEAATATPPTTTTTPADGRKATAYVEPKYAVNKKLDTVLDSIDRANLQRKFVEGFTIQIYSGSKREDALNAKKNLAASVPELTSEVQYAQPNFRVKVGKYYTRIDAQRDFMLIKKYFPTAIVIPDKVAIN